MLYRTISPPLLTNSTTSLRTCAFGCNSETTTSLQNYIPSAYRFNNVTANTLRLFEHCYNVFCSESNVFARPMSFFSSLSKITLEDTRVWLRDLSDCSQMLYHRAISPLHTDSITLLQTLSSCLSTVTRFFVPSQVFSRYWCHFSLVFRKLNTGTLGFVPGTSRTAAECSTTELYLLCLQILDNITANTLRLFEHCYNVFCSESNVFARPMSFFSSLSKITLEDTRVWLRDLSDCSQMLYHRAISPLHTDSITLLQTLSGCLSTVTRFFVPSQVFSRYWCHFSLVFRKLNTGTPGFVPGTSRTAAECSTTELYLLCLQILDNITANTLRLFEHCYKVFCSESSVLSLPVSSFSGLSKIKHGDTRVWLRDLSDCSQMLYHRAISPLHTDSITLLQTLSGCLSTVTRFFVPSQVFSRYWCHFSLVFRKLNTGTPGFVPGTSRTAAECSTTELYLLCLQILDNITANTLRLFEHCYKVFCSESSVLSLPVSSFSGLSKIKHGDTRVHTRDLSDWR